MLSNPTNSRVFLAAAGIMLLAGCAVQPQYRYVPQDESAYSTDTSVYGTVVEQDGYYAGATGDYYGPDGYYGSSDGYGSGNYYPGSYSGYGYPPYPYSGAYAGTWPGYGYGYGYPYAGGYFGYGLAGGYPGTWGYSPWNYFWYSPVVIRQRHRSERARREARVREAQAEAARHQRHRRQPSPPRAGAIRRGAVPARQVRAIPANDFPVQHNQPVQRNHEVRVRPRADAQALNATRRVRVLDRLPQRRVERDLPDASDSARRVVPPVHQSLHDLSRGASPAQPARLPARRQPPITASPPRKPVMPQAVPNFHRTAPVIHAAPHRAVRVASPRPAAVAAPSRHAARERHDER